MSDAKQVLMSLSASQLRSRLAELSDEARAVKILLKAAEAIERRRPGPTAEREDLVKPAANGK